jgi:hypothetical protein
MKAFAKLAGNSLAVKASRQAGEKRGSFFRKCQTDCPNWKGKKISHDNWELGMGNQLKAKHFSQIPSQKRDSICRDDWIALKINIRYNNFLFFIPHSLMINEQFPIPYSPI